MDALNILRRQTLAQYMNYKFSNGQRSQTQVKILLLCAVISLYSQKHL